MSEQVPKSLLRKCHNGNLTRSFSLSAHHKSELHAVWWLSTERYISFIFLDYFLSIVDLYKNRQQKHLPVINGETDERLYSGFSPPPTNFGHQFSIGEAAHESTQTGFLPRYYFSTLRCFPAVIPLSLSRQVPNTTRALWLFLWALKQGWTHKCHILYVSKGGL